ncbi:putative glycoside hydrolase [Brucepastera parasyntrophica]|uniref:putative glycoside hydrolase n=1 Tax=Brucepastera parasyntrophica TaxID=2880008 RepID=UPI003F6F77E6
MKLRFTVLLLYICTMTGILAEDFFLAGTDAGLYRINGARTDMVWKMPQIKKIQAAGDQWFFLTEKGIFHTKDFITFEERNTGLPVKLIKYMENGEKKFSSEVQELKDLKLHPANPDIMVTTTREAVYLSRDGGKTWKSQGMSATTAGAKSVCVLDLPDSEGTPQLTIFLSHPIYGISWRRPDAEKPVWTDLNEGLESAPTINWPDEVADIIAVPEGKTFAVYASQTFMPRIYRLDWNGNKFIKIWSGENPADTIDGLAAGPKSLVFSTLNNLYELPLPVTPGQEKEPPVHPVPDWNTIFRRIPGNLLSAWVPAKYSYGRGPLSLSELWLLDPPKSSSAYSKTADLKKGIYLPVWQVTTDEGFDKHIKTIKDNNLNMLVVDMKDDYGFIRYNTKDPLVLQKGKTGRGIDLEAFVKKAKENGIYLVARIVVFKDRELSKYGGGKYAVWDPKEKKHGRDMKI